MIIPAKMQKFLDEVVYPVNPDFKIKNKVNKSGLYAFFSFFGKLFNPEIDTRYITVVNGECWYPSDYFDEQGNVKESHVEGAIEIMAHETVHEYDRKRLGNFLYTMMYASPQIWAPLALGAIGAIWSPWWLLCLLFLLLIAPLPALGRAYIEIRGYRVNMMLERIKNGDPQSYADWAADVQFCGPAYFFMLPFKSYVVKKLLETDYEKEEIYTKIKNWFELNP